MRELDLLKYCEGCFGDEPPDLCELYRRRFVFLHHLSPYTYRLVRQLVEQNKGTFHSMGEMWGFDTTKENHQHILNMLNIFQVPVHTLEEHVHNLEARYSPNPLRLGKQHYLDLSEGQEWHVLNPQIRSWCRILHGYSGLLVRDGTILRCDLRGQTRFYWFKGLNEDGTPRIVELQERATWNIAVRYFEPRTVYWVEHGELGVGVITGDSLGRLPDDIFAALVKFRPFEKHLPGLFIFEAGDYELIKRVLRCVNVQMIKSTKIILLPGDPDKLHGTAIIPASEIPADRLDPIKKILEGFAKNDVTYDDNGIEVPLIEGKLKLVFVSRPKGCALDKIFYVPLDALEDTKRIYELILSISKHFKLGGNEVEKIFAVHWSAKNDVDTSFMLDVFIRNLDDAQFVQQFLRVQENRAVVRQWYEGATRNYLKMTIPLDILRRVRESLALWP